MSNGRQLSHDIRTARSRWDEVVTARSGATAWKVVDLLVQHPVVDAGIVVESSRGRIGRLWRAPEILDPLDARAGRRSAQQR